MGGFLGACASFALRREKARLIPNHPPIGGAVLGWRSIVLGERLRRNEAKRVLPHDTRLFLWIAEF